MNRYIFHLPNLSLIALLCISIGIASMESLEAQPLKSSRDVKVSPEEIGEHVVQEGESLYSIARKYKMSVEDLKRLNNLNGPGIFPNDRLRYIPFDVISPSETPFRSVEEQLANTGGNIPVFGPANDFNNRSISTSARMVSTNPSATGARGLVLDPRLRAKTYTVKKGDNLFRIADTYRVNVDQLRSWNSISGNLIRPGDQLIVGQYAEGLQESPSLSTFDRQPVVTNYYEPPILKPAGTPVLGNPSNSPNVVDRNWQPLNNRPTTTTPTPKFRSGPENVPPTPAGKREEWGTFLAYDAIDSQGHVFYGLHKTLPPGSRLQLAIPNHPVYLEVHIIGNLRSTDPAIVALSRPIVDIIKKAGAPREVKIVY